jgi:hypothetical protein
VIPVIYQRISERTYRGVDPRVYVSPEDECTEVQAATAVTSPLNRALDANEPVRVPKWRITGHSNPGLRQRYPWMAGPGCVRVHPNDTVVETDDDADGM